MQRERECSFGIDAVLVLWRVYLKRMDALKAASSDEPHLVGFFLSNGKKLESDVQTSNGIEIHVVITSPSLGE